MPHLYGRLPHRSDFHKKEFSSRLPVNKNLPSSGNEVSETLLKMMRKGRGNLSGIKALKKEKEA